MPAPTDLISEAEHPVAADVVEEVVAVADPRTVATRGAAAPRRMSKVPRKAIRDFTTVMTVATDKIPTIRMATMETKLPHPHPFPRTADPKMLLKAMVNHPMRVMKVRFSCNPLLFREGEQVMPAHREARRVRAENIRRPISAVRTTISGGIICQPPELQCSELSRR